MDIKLELILERDTALGAQMAVVVDVIMEVLILVPVVVVMEVVVQRQEEVV